MLQHLPCQPDSCLHSLLSAPWHLLLVHSADVDGCPAYSDTCIEPTAAVAQTMDECQSVLKGYTSAERRAILGLALPDEGLDLSHLTVAQGHRLWDLTCPVQPGSDRRILASAYHQISLQVRQCACLKAVGQATRLYRVRWAEEGTSVPLRCPATL